MAKTPTPETHEPINPHLTAPLNKIDRCDRCGAQAYVRVHTTAGHELLWCAHHWASYADGMVPITLYVHDERKSLEPPTPSEVSV